MRKNATTRYGRLRDVIVPILAPLGVRRIAIFGSAARGDTNADSDVDILVELKKPDERPPIGLKWFRAERELSQALGRSVDLVSSAGLHPLIRPNVERDLVVLYDEG